MLTDGGVAVGHVIEDALMLVYCFVVWTIAIPVVAVGLLIEGT